MEELITKNPTEKIRNPTPPPQERESFLDENELQILLKTIEKLEYPYKQLLTILIITGQRKNEVMGMCKSELDLENGFWTIPENRTKGKRKHIIPLTPFLIDVIKNVPHNGEYILSLDNGETPIKYIQYIKAKIDKCVGFKDWIIHDLRRTAATWMVNLGINEFHVKILLNHSSKKSELKVTSAYIQSKYFEQKKNALEKYESFLQIKNKG